MNCMICGAYIDKPFHPKQKYCPECRKKHDAELNRQSKARQRERKKKRKAEADATPTIAQIDGLAKKSGMSYGRYVLKHGL